MSLNQRRAGFSLIELLVALTILAIALIPVAYFYSKSLQQVEQQSIRTRALTMAYERMAEIQQMPASQIRKNNEMSASQRFLLEKEGVIDTANEDWTGKDFANNITANPNPKLGTGGEAHGMFFYPVPLTFNPYQPATWGYDNTLGVEHFLANDGIHPAAVGAPSFGSHINLNDGGTYFPQYEYEPIGFYKQRVITRDASLNNTELSDISQGDRRAISSIDPPLNSAGTPADYFRTGTEDDADKYAIYGRRTVIIKYVPMSDAVDTDGDVYGPNDDFDGGATAVNPNPIAKGPDDKFTKVAEYGPGYEVTVQVFWLPRGAPEAYIPWEDLNKVELKAFVAEDGSFNWLDDGRSSFSRNRQLIITPAT